MKVGKPRSALATEGSDGERAGVKEESQCNEKLLDAEAFSVRIGVACVRRLVKQSRRQRSPWTQHRKTAPSTAPKNSPTIPSDQRNRCQKNPKRRSFPDLQNRTPWSAKNSVSLSPQARHWTSSDTKNLRRGSLEHSRRDQNDVWSLGTYSRAATHRCCFPQPGQVKNFIE